MKEPSPAGATERVSKRVRLTREAREQQLLDVAEALFTDQGVAATSIEDIARAAGVTRPMLYDHFGHRDAILLACVKRARLEFEQRLVEAVTAIGHRGDLGAVLEVGGDVFFALLQANPRRWSLLFSSTTALSGEVTERLTDLRFGTVECIVELARGFAPGVSDERLRAAAHAMAGVGEQLGRWWLRAPNMSRRQVVAHYREFILGGFLGMIAEPKRDGANRKKARRTNTKESA